MGCGSRMKSDQTRLPYSKITQWWWCWIGEKFSISICGLIYSVIIFYFFTNPKNNYSVDLFKYLLNVQYERKVKLTKMLTKAGWDSKRSKNSRGCYNLCLYPPCLSLIHYNSTLVMVLDWTDLIALEYDNKHIPV